MNKLRLQNQGGFTLIELLVVVAIIGILAAIAIPQFAAYRKRGHEAQVKSDLRNAAVSQEAYFAANSTYINANPMTRTNSPGFNATNQVTVESVRGTNVFTLTASHVNCVGVNWTFSSVNGTIAGPNGGCP